MAVGIFAGIAVSDFARALEWYRRLLGTEPAFFPNDVEAVWQLAEDRYVYIIRDPERAGGAVGMIWVDDPVAEVARIAAGTRAGRRREARRGVEVRVPRRRRQRDRHRGPRRLFIARSDSSAAWPGRDGILYHAGAPVTPLSIQSPM